MCDFHRQKFSYSQVSDGFKNKVIMRGSNFIAIKIILNSIENIIISTDYLFTQSIKYSIDPIQIQSFKTIQASASYDLIFLSF
jgi:hypothetical protein